MNFDGNDDDKKRELRRLAKEEERARDQAIAREDARQIRDARRARGWSQPELARRSGVAQQQISAIENFKYDKSGTVIKLKRALGLVEDDGKVMSEALAKRQQADILRHSSNVIEPTGHADLPLFGCVEAGDGRTFMCLSKEPIDMLVRPERLLHVRRAYAVTVSGESMRPRFRPGEILYVDPGKPVIPGEDYLFYAEENDEVIVKHLLKVLTNEWRVLQYNPMREFELRRNVWTRVERVVTTQHRS